MESGWERSPHYLLSPSEIQDLITPAFPSKQVAHYELLTSGLANTNYKFWLQGQPGAYVLRLNTRDPAAALREQALMNFLAKHPQPHIPFAPLLFAQPQPSPGQPAYSIWGFVEGHLLQTLFHSCSGAELCQIAEACGQVLAGLSAHRFAACGEFGPDLEIITEYGAPSQFVPGFVEEALWNGLAGQRLQPALRDALWSLVRRERQRLEAIDGDYRLVHADFKRSNLLMHDQSGRWQVAAILDWEFACAGPPLIDVGLFLRAGSGLPAGFAEAFAQGFRQAGGQLPADWLQLSRLLDLIAQLTFLNTPEERPQVFAENRTIIQETLSYFEN